jgi:hypothetical protein
MQGGWWWFNRFPCDIGWSVYVVLYPGGDQEPMLTERKKKT